jgi:hypothetical protein
MCHDQEQIKGLPSLSFPPSTGREKMNLEYSKSDALSSDTQRAECINIIASNVYMSVIAHTS